MNITALLGESEALVRDLDPVVEDIGDVALQSIADWAWYRLGCVNFLVRDEVGGPLAATLARGLIEQAAYWDWALATGSGVDHLAQWAALELQGLQRVADETQDWAWLGWRVPPAVSLDAQAGPAIPRNPYDAVRRIGSGLDEVVLNPLRFRGLFAAYEVLGLVTHGNIAGAMLLADQPDLQLPERLAAIAVHLASAGATAVVHALAGGDIRMPNATGRFERIAGRAATIHELPPHSSQATQSPRRTARAIDAEQLSARATAQQMPVAPPGLTQLGLNFVSAADRLAKVIASNADPELVDGSVIPDQSFWSATSHLKVIQGALEGTMGKALIPIAARALFEDGARWEWLRHSSQHARRGESLKALVNEAALRRDTVAKHLESDGVPRRLIDDLLGMSRAIPLSEPSEVSIPRLQAMLSLAYPNPSGVNSARAMYSVLTQFVHATPISNWHILRDNFPSLTAPIYAISLECAAQGFERIASVTPAMAGVDSAVLSEPLEVLRVRCREVMLAAGTYHLLG
ncbi:MAG: hypothetical protein OXB99_16165 [Acidimicrobiaceae bacterium]|nr:hypothetical protein [Acidimicrobiaceae bacterium]